MGRRMMVGVLKDTYSWQVSEWWLAQGVDLVSRGPGGCGGGGGDGGVLSV